MCRFNMEKNLFVLAEMERILDALTRGLDLDVLSRGYGKEARGVPISYQAQSPILGLVLPSNSPGVHTLWLPIIPLQIGLVLKPGPQEPWTPYRMAAVLPPDNPKAALAAFTVPGQADAINTDIENDLKAPGVKDYTAKYGQRLVKKERCDYLRPTVIHCDSPDAAIAKKEYMFPFCTVVKCPQDRMLEKIGPTLVCSAITEDKKFQRALIEAVHIDRLNIGAIPTIKLNWLQPHEGSIVDFLFRGQAFQCDKTLGV